MADDFIDEAISVEYDADKMVPTAFTWRRERYVVAEVLRAWQDWSTGGYAHARGWIHRRHRNYYLVATADGQVFELYLDRGAKRRTWVLLRRRPAPD